MIVRDLFSHINAEKHKHQSVKIGSKCKLDRKTDRKTNQNDAKREKRRRGFEGGTFVLELELHRRARLR